MDDRSTKMQLNSATEIQQSNDHLKRNINKQLKEGIIKEQTNEVR